MAPCPNDRSSGGIETLSSSGASDAGRGQVQQAKQAVPEHKRVEAELFAWSERRRIAGVADAPLVHGDPDAVNAAEQLVVQHVLDTGDTGTSGIPDGHRHPLPRLDRRLLDNLGVRLVE